MGNPHILAIPYPAQGHVIPLLELMQCLAKQGFKVTFVNSDFIHERFTSSLSGKDDVDDRINMVSIPDGVEAPEDRDDFGKFIETIRQVMSGNLEQLIEKINASEDNKITCVVADNYLGWALEVAEKMQIRRASFWPASALEMITGFKIPELLRDGIVDKEGTPQKNDMLQLFPNMPALNPAHLSWACIGDLATQKIVFKMYQQICKTAKSMEWIICNTFYELERAAFDSFPNIKPIGPLLASNRQGNSSGFFWPEDSTCLEWLDQHPVNSVIYVAFGSFTVFDKLQFQKLALGLELTNKPFLWVVRPDMTGDELDDAYTTGFKDRVGPRGRMVGWAPQQKVLSHPSIACFLTHCGWNSTMEGISNGKPFLCWPYFVDQFKNMNYICDIWKVGLGFQRNESGIIGQEEIKDKVEKILLDKKFKERIMELKDMAERNVNEGGLSHNNFNNFIEWLKS